MKLIFPFCHSNTSISHMRMMSRKPGLRVSLAILSVILTMSVLISFWLTHCPKLSRLTMLSKSTCSSSSVVLAKTHKCASTSLQNVLLRHAYKNELDVALPAMGNYLGRHRKFEREHLMATPWFEANFTYDMFALHAIYNHEAIMAIMKSKPLVVTIVREPVDLFISLWDYVDMQKVYRTDLETFALSQVKKDRVGNLGRNQMLFDLGLDEKLFEDLEAVSKKIESLDEQFDLVLVAEQFDQSMVLLKDRLCWPTENVAYLKLNVRERSRKSRISERARDALKQWLWADVMLYEHFVDEFQRKIEKFGANQMEIELHKLREENENIREKCVATMADSHSLKGDFRLWGKHTLGYQLKDDADDDCQLFAISEISLIDRLRQAQTLRAQQILQQRDLSQS